MIVRLRRRTLNLAHMALAEDIEEPPEGMRIYVVGNIVRDLDRPDARRLRRRFIELDPEPLEDEELTEKAVVREPGRVQKRRGRGPAGGA